MNYTGSFGQPDPYVELIDPIEGRDGKVRLLQIDYHRNGSGGAGFYAAILDTIEGRMLVTSFSANPYGDGELGYGYTSAIAIDLLDETYEGETVGIAFGLNSWRGADNYEGMMQTFAADHAFLRDMAVYGKSFVEQGEALLERTRFSL